jgi:hypothetical protein
MVYVIQDCWQLVSRIRTEWYMSYRFAGSLRAGSGRNGICHTGLLTACEQDQDVMIYVIQVCWQLASWIRKGSCSQAVSKPVWHIPLLCVQWKTPDDGQRNCPKHVEFYSRNKFEKLVHLVGFITRKTANVCSTDCCHMRTLNWRLFELLS